MMPEVGFQFSYSVFSGSQLSRQLMSHSESLLILCLGIRGRAMKQPQNGLGRPVNRIASFRFGVWFWRKLNDCFCRNWTAITHSHPPHYCLREEFHHSRLFEAIDRLWITRLCRCVWLPCLWASRMAIFGVPGPARQMAYNR
jgi:hypothetical protein